jgi:hypothetical protein
VPRDHGKVTGNLIERFFDPAVWPLNLLNTSLDTKMADLHFNQLIRVARFFLVHNTQARKSTKLEQNAPKWTYNIPNVRNILQMAVKYFIIFQSKALQNLPKFGF